jgi:hypothetical protein
MPSATATAAVTSGCPPPDSHVSSTPVTPNANRKYVAFRIDRIRKSVRQRLLHEFDASVPGEPFDVAKRLLPGLPAFIGVDANRFLGSGAAKGLEIIPVAGNAHLEFKNWKGLGVTGFFFDDARFVDPNAERGR